MKCQGSLGQLGQRRLFQRLGERVKERPDVPGIECFMPRLPPFGQHVRDVAVGTDPSIERRE